MGRRGFTLIELSIVLAIIGLIVGGITLGSEVIRQGQLREAMNEFQQFQTAHRMFQTKYSGIAGDFAEGHKYFRTKATGCTNNAFAACVGAGVDLNCNGNGDGYVVYNTTPDQCEQYKYWMHLSLAGMIEGDFSGTFEGGAHSNRVRGTNVPKNSLSKSATWNVDRRGPQAFGYSAGTGFNQSVNLLYTPDSAVTVEEARLLDEKIDDGRVANGKMIASQNCATTTNSDTALFNLTDPDLLCTNVGWRLEDEELNAPGW
jgi:prepilin-type N-terminal cleavage/methylation domain-containing protein